MHIDAPARPIERFTPRVAMVQLLASFGYGTVEKSMVLAGMVS